MPVVQWAGAKVAHAQDPSESSAAARDSRSPGVTHAAVDTRSTGPVMSSAREVGTALRRWPDNLPAIRLYEKLGFIADANTPPGGWAAPGETTMVWRPSES